MTSSLPLLRNGGHRAYVRAVRVVSGSGLHTAPFAVTVGYDGTLRTHRLPGLRPGAVAHAHAMGAGALDVTPDGRAVTAGADGVVRFWRVALDTITPYAAVGMPIADADPLIETATWLPDGRSAIVGVVGGSVWEIDPDAGTSTFVDEEGMLSINAIVPSADGRFLFIASDECTVRRYRREGGGWVREHTSAPMDDHVDALALSPDGGTLLASTHGRSLWRSDSPFGALFFTSAPVARDAINALAWAGDVALFGGDDRVVYAADPSGANVQALADTLRDVDSIAVVDARYVLAATTGGLVEIDRVARTVSARSQDRGALAAVFAESSAAGERVYVGQHDAGRIVVGRLDTDGGETLLEIAVPAPVSCGAATAPVFGLATGLVVRVEGGRAVPLFTAGAEVEGVDVVEAEGLVLAVDRSGTLTVLDGGVRASVRITGWGRRLKAVRFARIGGARLALCAGKDHRLHAVHLDDLDRGAWEIVGSNVALRTFNDLLVEGDRVYAACWDRTIHCLELGSGTHVTGTHAALVGHTHAVERMLMVDGTLVSVSYDGTLRGWPRDGAPGFSVPLSPLAVRRVAPAGVPGRVVTAGYDGIVREIDLSTHTVTRHWRVV